MPLSPWLHQKRSESAPPAHRLRDPPAITLEKQEENVARISRPTEAALYRRSLAYKLDSFMERGRHSWAKMELFEDCKRCMWTPRGTIKPSCKIRPLNQSHQQIPPVASTPRSLGGLSVLGLRTDGVVTKNGFATRNGIVSFDKYGASGGYSGARTHRPSLFVSSSGVRIPAAPRSTGLPAQYTTLTSLQNPLSRSSTFVRC